MISKRIFNRLKSKIATIGSSNVQSMDAKEFDKIISTFDDDTVFLHIGLSDIKSAFNRNPYDFLMEKLETSFQTLIVPGFTPSFKQTGIFHKKFSFPEYGTFPKLFLHDAEYRTDDAIHSVLIRGNNRYTNCQNRDSFSEESCWAKFDEENTLILNIGTEKFLMTQLYYIERRNNLPYVEKPKYDGVIYSNPYEFSTIRQVNHKCQHNFPVSMPPNWRKIESYLKSTNSLWDFSTNGLTVYAFRAKDVRISLENKLEEDEYFLRT